MIGLWMMRQGRLLIKMIAFALRNDYDDYNSFNEPWAVRHPDSMRVLIQYTVHYGSSFVDKKNLGFRRWSSCNLPMPASATDLNVSSADVNFAKIVNIGDRVDEYIQRSGLTIQPNLTISPASKCGLFLHVTSITNRLFPYCIYWLFMSRLSYLLGHRRTNYV